MNKKISIALGAGFVLGYILNPGRVNIRECYLPKEKVNCCSDSRRHMDKCRDSCNSRHDGMSSFTLDSKCVNDSVGADSLSNYLPKDPAKEICLPGDKTCF
ncbi:hypothetical protein HYT23_04400 [Candidatus Pacearchaeota archaeon]|nr:hypothetical protein [Candidatus Pacearchaeota archaeon]